MKNKTIIRFLIVNIFFMFSFTSDLGQGIAKKGRGEIAKKILELNINANPLTVGISIYTFDIFNDTLYVVNKGNFIQISLKTGEISKNLPISDFLKTKLKSHISANNIRVCDSGYYVSCINELYFIDHSGKANKISDNNGSMINDFSIAGDKIIIASRGDKIKLIGKNGSVISTSSLEMADNGHIRSYSGLCYDSGDYIYESNINRNNQIFIRRYASISSIKGVKDLDISFNSNKGFVGFAYNQRSNLYIISKSATKNEILKTISLGQSYVKNKEATDEGKPNFRVKTINNFNYLVLISNQKLTVFTFDF